MVKTLLVNPDSQKIYGIGGQSAFPLGLGYIAAVLEKYHNVKVIDVGAEKLSDDSLRKIVSGIDPKIVGITSDTITFQRAIEIAKLVKQTNEEIVVVIGGAHSNALPAYPLRYNCFDISVYGEGERTAIELWDRIERREPYEGIKGTAFRRKDKIIINPKRELIENLDELPFPARHLFPMRKYGDESSLYISPVYHIGTSRGCPFSCTFCSNNVVFGRKYRFRSAKNVVDEIELLVKTHKAKGIYFREDLFTVNRKRVIDICSEIKERGLKFKWECESRVNTINEEMIRAMKGAGCELVWCGVESGSQEILNYLNKEITLSQIKEAYSIFKKVGMKAGATFMIGIPGETMNDIYETINLAKSLKLEFAAFAIFTGYPTSPLYEYVRQNKLYEKEVSHGILIVKPDGFNREKLEKIQRYANRKTNRNMRRLLRYGFLEIKHGTLTLQKVIEGLRYLLGR